MEFDEYQEKTGETAVYPEEDVIDYLALGVAGEAGEIAEKIKKQRRGDRGLEGVKHEIGDLLWYLARLSEELGHDFSEIASGNLEKVRKREEEGTILGSGDER